MNKKCTIMLSVLLVIVLIPFNTFSDISSSNNSSALILTLEEMQQLLKNNIELKLYDRKIEISQKKYQDALKAASDTQGKTSYNENENLKLKKDEKLNGRIALLELEDIKNQRTEKFESLSFQIKSQYYNSMLLQNDINIISEEIKVLDTKIRQSELKVKLGQLKETEYKTLYAQKVSMQNQLSELNKQQNNILIYLKRDLGISQGKKITLKETYLPYVSLVDTNLEESVSSYISTNYGLIKIQNEIELKKVERDITIEYSSPKSTSAVNSLDVSIAENESKLANEKVTIEADLWSQYYDIKILDENIALEELNLEIEKLNYDTIQAKAKLGMVDAATESNARIAYNRQKNNLQRAKYNYILTVEQFNDKLEK